MKSFIVSNRWRYDKNNHGNVGFKKQLLCESSDHEVMCRKYLRIHHKDTHGNKSLCETQRRRPLKCHIESKHEGKWKFCF